MCHVAGVKANMVEDRGSEEGEGTEGLLGEGECQTGAAGAERRQRK